MGSMRELVSGSFPWIVADGRSCRPMVMSAKRPVTRRRQVVELEKTVSTPTGTRIPY
jgi:hypothetical protein